MKRKLDIHEVAWARRAFARTSTENAGALPEFALWRGLDAQGRALVQLAGDTKASAARVLGALRVDLQRDQSDSTEVLVVFVGGDRSQPIVVDASSGAALRGASLGLAWAVAAYATRRV